MSVMQSPPAPCPAGQIPDATGIAAFSAAYEAARAVFVCIARSGQRWTVKADTFTTPTHVVDEVVAAAIREAPSAGSAAPSAEAKDGENTL
jgi:hypothetical protein